MKLRRLFGTGAAVVFKGSGFYQTDYRSESYKQRAAEEKKASSDSSSKSSSEGKKSESKSDGGSGGSKPSKSKES